MVFATLLLSAAVSAPTSAGTRSAAPAMAYLRSSWTTEDGLPQNTVTELLQTRDGYLWLGTLGGLVRFDGVRFSVYTAATTPALPSNRIQALAEASDGTLLIGAEVGGIVSLRGGSFEAFAGNAALPGEFVQSLLVAKDGGLWAGTTQGLARIDGTRVTDHTTRCGLPSPNVQALADAEGGGLWIGTIGGLVLCGDHAPPRIFGVADGLSSAVVKSLHRDADGTLWVGTTQGTARREGDGFRELRSQSGASLGRTTALARDTDGSLWIGAGPSGVFHHEAGQALHYQVEAGLSDNQTQSLLVDREGTLWVGSNRSGLVRWRRRGIANLSKAEGLGGTGVLPILEDRRGAIWVGSYCGGLTRFDAGRVDRFDHYDKPAGLENTCINALHEDRSGRLWAGTEGGGLFVFEGGRFAAPPGTREALGLRVNVIEEDRAGRLWIGSAQGLHALVDGRLTSYRVRDGLVHDDVRVIRQDRTGVLWIGTSGGLSRLQDGRFTNYTKRNGLSHDYIREIYEDSEGVLWIGSYGGGLMRFASGRFTHYTREAGLFDEVVSRILVDDRDRFWMSGNRGVYRASRKELNDYAAGRLRSVSCVAYGASDGMASGETNGGGQPAGWRSRDGRLWFPTLAGVAVFDPELLANELPPPVAIEAVYVDQRPVPPQAALQLPAGARSLELRYTAPSLAAPDKVRFRYALEGFEREMVDAGGRRSAYYTSLRPGRYRFRVIAANNEGVWNEQGATLAIVQLPHFYETVWFAACAMLGLCATGAAGYLARVRRLLRRTRELESRVAERTVEVVAQKNELARVNTRLERANDEMAAVLDGLRAAVLLLDSDGRVGFLNQAAQTFFELDRQADVGQAWTELLPLAQADRERLESSWAEPAARRSKLPVRVERAGRRFWMEVETQDDPRDPARRILFLYDVSETYDLRRLLDEKAQFHGLVGEGRAIQLVFRQVRDVAPVEATVLIEGETGTGKELVARAIHYLSPRKHRPFVAVNCAGLTESLLASQLFGHRRGAFTGAVADQLGLFEAAEGGTIFLDEIGEIPASVQNSLLRVLQEREVTRLGETKPRKVDIRVLAATHRDLGQAVAAGSFRQDLLYRIRVTKIPVPALRERREDIPLLVAWFLGQARAATDRRVADISLEAMQVLVEYAWPGNVRELKSAIESAVIGCSGSVIGVKDLPEEIAAAAGATLTPDERQRIKEALARTEGNRAAAARLLGMGRTTLYRRLKELDIDEADERA